MVQHSKDYTMLKNRILYGAPFYKKDALTQIDYLSNNLLISREEADELIELANKYGKDDFDKDLPQKVEDLEAVTATQQADIDILYQAVADSIGGADVMGGAI